MHPSTYTNRVGRADSAGDTNRVGRADSAKHTNRAPKTRPPKTRPRVEPWRIMMALTVVGAVVAALWFWGRPPDSPPQVAVVVTSERWAKGAEPAGFQLVYMPAELATRFVQPTTLPGNVAAVDIPPGVYVAASQLTAKHHSTAGDTTLMSFAADYTAWPDPGARSGDWAVVSAVVGGCALHVVRLFAVTDATAVVEVDPVLATELAEITRRQPLVLWQSPEDGWPDCNGDLVAPTPASSSTQEV